MRCIRVARSLCHAMHIETSDGLGPFESFRCVPESQDIESQDNAARPLRARITAENSELSSRLQEGSGIVRRHDASVRPWRALSRATNSTDVHFIEELAPEEIIGAARSINSDKSVIDIARTSEIRRFSASGKDRLVMVLEEDATR